MTSDGIEIYKPYVGAEMYNQSEGTQYLVPTEGVVNCMHKCGRKIMRRVMNPEPIAENHSVG